MGSHGTGSMDGREELAPPQSWTTITIKHKVPNGTRQLQLAAHPCDSFRLETDGVCILEMPPALCKQLEVLRQLPHVQEVEKRQVVQARLALEEWFHGQMPSCAHYFIRNVTVRDSHCETAELLNRKQLAVQRPGGAFHIDAEHTSLINLWLPLVDEHEAVSDFQFGFLRLATGALLRTADLNSMYKRDRRDFDRFAGAASVVYKPRLRWGHVVVFQSGGEAAVCHGSFRFDHPMLRTNARRTSVEFRCQRREADGQSWAYGTSDEGSPGQGSD